MDGDRIATGHGFTELCHDVLCGTLLGDGSISGASSHFQLAHSTQQEEYARWKAELLAELEPVVQVLNVAAVAGGPRVYGAVHLRTRASRALRTLRQGFYRDRKRIPLWLADQMNYRMLAIWFLDDGYVRHRANRRPRAEIATNGFDVGDLQTLLVALSRLGLPAKTLRGRIFFDADTSRLLSERIAPYTPLSMRYKLDPEVAERIPFDPTLFEPGAPRVLFDTAEVVEVTDEARHDTTFFCIDVEENHNFVTAGWCRAQLPAPREPRPEAGGDRGVRGAPLPPDRADPADPGRDARQLRDEAPLGQAARASPRCTAASRRSSSGGTCAALSDLPSRGRALHRRMLEVLEDDFRRIPELLGREAVPPPPPAPLSRAEPVAPGRAPGPARPLLDTSTRDGLVVKRRDENATDRPQLDELPGTGHCSPNCRRQRRSDAGDAGRRQHAGLFWTGGSETSPWSDRARRNCDKHP